MTEFTSEDEDYMVGEPSEQVWWKRFCGEEEIDEVRKVFSTAGVEPVYGSQQEYISPEAAFDEDDIGKIWDAAEEIYDEFEEFIDQTAESTVHPQHSHQITKAWDYERISKEPPTKFAKYDGMAVRDCV